MIAGDRVYIPNSNYGECTLLEITGFLFKVQLDSGVCLLVSHVVLASDFLNPAQLTYLQTTNLKHDKATRVQVAKANQLSMF
jgi:hypothetical protein